MNYINFDDAEYLAVDIESHDPLLLERGPGVYRGDGEVLGVAIYDELGRGDYWDFGHVDGDKSVQAGNRVYIGKILASKTPKVFANGIYDLDWLVNHDKFVIGGDWHDVQLAEPLIDENRRSYSLDTLAQHYLGEKKQNDALKAWCAQKNLKGDPRQYIWMMPYELVRGYGRGDGHQTIRVFLKQMEIIKSLGLEQLYKMECDIMRVALKMRKNGVTIDTAKAQNTALWLDKKIKEAEKELFSRYGEFNYNSMPQQKKVFERLGLDIPKNIVHKESFDKQAIAYYVKHEIGQMILTARKLRTAREYLQGSILDNLVGNKIHTQFIQLRADDSGTVSGRFSSRNPNLQQVSHIIRKPSDPLYYDDLGVRLRSLFIPQAGRTHWVKLDMSQIEYRLIAHYALGPGADEIRRRYNEDLSTDYHAEIMQLTGITDRRDAKALNFGKAYFMGVWKMAFMNLWSEEKSQELSNIYNAKVPFLKYTANHTIDVAKARDIVTKGHGYIRTILGRYARISDEMRKWKKEYSLFNRLIQGSAADIFKMSLVNADKAGIFDVIPLHLIVHDENDVSVNWETPIEKEAVFELKHHMQSSVKLKVPMIADMEIGPNWAEIDEVKE